MDYIDSLFNDEITSTQVSIIEGLLITAAIPQKEKEQIDLDLLELTKDEAQKMIRYLNENNTFNDPRKKFEHHIKNKT